MLQDATVKQESILLHSIQENQAINLIESLNGSILPGLAASSNSLQCGAVHIREITDTVIGEHRTLNKAREKYMSNKRNKDGKKVASLDLSETSNKISTANELNNIERLEKGGIITYLKTRWWVIGVIALLSLGALGAGLKYLEEDARQQILSGKLKKANSQNQSLLNSINPFLPVPLPNPTPQLSKEYIFAGDRLLAVEDANAMAVPPADLAVWRESTGWWFVRGPDGNIQASQHWGTEGDKPRPGDYDGDGKTDFCVFRPSDNTWYILRSSDGVINGITFGATGDTPVPPADYDGDGKTDIAVFRPNVPTSGNATWYIRKSSDGGFWSIAFGVNSDGDEKKLAPADFDGDGKADVTVWRNSDMNFYTLRSIDGGFQTTSMGQTSAEIVSGDYDGDGKADYAIRNGANWIIRYSTTGAIPTQALSWGQATDEAVHNDYDGDGKVDVAVWRADGGNWYIRQSTRIGQTDEMRWAQWGQQGDVPVPALYRR